MAARKRKEGRAPLGAKRVIGKTERRGEERKEKREDREGTRYQKRGMNVTGKAAGLGKDKRGEAVRREKLYARRT